MNEPRTEAGKAAKSDWAELAESGDVAVWDDGTDIYDHIAAHVVAIEAEAGALDAAWREAEAALPEGADLMVGHTTECPFCSGWWATASKRPAEPPYYPVIVSSEDGRPRGEHHDPTPALALQALTALLRDKAVSR